MRINLLLLVITFTLIFLGVMCGSEFISPSEIWRNFHAGKIDPIIQLRFTRMLAALVAGGALSISGAILQVALRNPLAEPFTLGISSGAGVGAATAILYGWRLTEVYAIHFSAFAGAVIVLLVVLCVSRFGARGEVNLLLSGVIAGSLANSILLYLVSGSNHQQLANVVWWLGGDLQAVAGKFLWTASGWLIIAAVILRWFGGDLNTLAISPQMAWSFGARPRQLLILLIALASLLTAAVVAMAGIIGFCGLIIPAIGRRLFGCDYRRLIFPLIFSGGIFLMTCDIFSRVIFTAREIPIGVITAFVGAPVFWYLLNRRRGAGQ